MGPALLDRLDRIMAELAELRAEVVASANGTDVRAYVSANPIEHEPDDLAPDSLLDTCAASAGYPQDTIRKWCRTEGLGIHTGGRWLVSIPRLQRRGGDRLSLLRSPFVDGARRQVTKAVSGRIRRYFEAGACGTAEQKTPLYGLPCPPHHFIAKPGSAHVRCDLHPG